MSVFEQLRPFVSLCQAIGIIPYTIEQDLTFFQSLVVVGFVSFSISQIEELSRDPNMPITVAVVVGVNWVSSITQLLISRWIVLHYRQLKRAVDAIQQVERLFGEKFIAQHKSSVGTRFIIGFILIVLTAAGTMMVFAPVYQAIFPAKMMDDLPILTATFSVLMLVFVMFDCTFFLFHLCYYIIAHYIQLLVPYLDLAVDDNDPMTSSEGRKYSWRTSTLIFGYLCRASSELNSIFSIPALFILLMKFIAVVSSAFVYIYAFLHTNDVLEKYISLLPVLFFTDWIRMLILLSAADLPVNQVRIFREHIVTTSYSGEVQPVATTIAVSAMVTLVQIDEERVRLSAAGLFNVGMFMIPALTGAAVTYLAILLQN